MGALSVMTSEEESILRKVEHYLRSLDDKNVIGMLSGGVSNDLRFAGVGEKVCPRLAHRLIAAVDMTLIEEVSKQLFALANNETLLLGLIRAAMMS